VSRFDIAIAGEINLDIILYGLPTDLPLERELLAERCMVTLGSSSAILAHNLSVLGSRVGFVTRVGEDPLGKISLERLTEGGVDLSRIVRSAGPATTGLTLVLQHGQGRRMLTYPGTMFEMRFEDLDLDYLASARHFHLSSFFLHRSLRDRIPELFRRMKAAGLSTSMDTNDDPEDRWDGPLHQALPYVDVLLPNQREATKIAGVDDLDGALNALSEQVPTVVVKMGSRGAMACRQGQRVTEPALPVEALDAVGAGDSFNAGFLYRYLQGADLATCLRWGNLAGAFSTTRPGGTEAFRDRAAWQEFLRKHGARD